MPEIEASSTEVICEPRWNCLEDAGDVAVGLLALEDEVSRSVESLCAFEPTGEAPASTPPW